MSPFPLLSNEETGKPLAGPKSLASEKTPVFGLKEYLAMFELKSVHVQRAFPNPSPLILWLIGKDPLPGIVNVVAKLKVESIRKKHTANNLNIANPK